MITQPLISLKRFDTTCCLHHTIWSFNDVVMDVMCNYGAGIVVTTTAAHSSCWPFQKLAHSALTGCFPGTRTETYGAAMTLAVFDNNFFHCSMCSKRVVYKIKKPACSAWSSVLDIYMTACSQRADSNHAKRRGVTRSSLGHEATSAKRLECIFYCFKHWPNCATVMLPGKT